MFELWEAELNPRVYCAFGSVYLLEVRNTGLVDFDVTRKTSLLMGHFGILMTDIMTIRKNVITLLYVA